MKTDHHYAGKEEPARDSLTAIGAGVAAVINTPIHDGNGGASNASFSVDIEQIPGLIAKYEEARDKLRDIQRKGVQLARIAPPGEDPVSDQMANSLSKMAGQQPGQLGDTVGQAITRLSEQIDQLKAAQRDYQATDEAARPSQA